MTVALDKDADEARPYIERAAATHPSLIDVQHSVAHLYGIINISSVVWIDENGHIVKPAAIEYGSDMFKEFHGRDAEPHLEAVRRWVRTGELPLSREQALGAQVPPTADEQLARVHFTLARHLAASGADQAAAGHFDKAAELSPHDWTIRRGSMPIRGQDPMGEDFFKLYTSWQEAGSPDYESLAAERNENG